MPGTNGIHLYKWTDGYTNTKYLISSKLALFGLFSFQNDIKSGVLRLLLFSPFICAIFAEHFAHMNMHYQVHSTRQKVLLFQHFFNKILRIAVLFEKVQNQFFH